MKHMIRVKNVALALAVLLGVGASPARAQNLRADEIFLQSMRDITATSFEYCRTLGMDGSPIDKPIVLRVKLAAGAGSTTVTGTGAFANVVVGDLLLINNGSGVTLYRTVMTRASADSITVNTSLSAAALSNLNAQYRHLVCGATDTSGSFPVAGAHSFSIQLILSQINATSMDYQIECRVEGPAKAWSIVSGPTNKTTTFNTIFTTDLPFSECRVASKINTSSGVQQFTVNVQERF